MALKKSELIDLFNSQSEGLPQEVKNQILEVTGRGNVSASRDYIRANCLLAEFKKYNPTVALSSISSKAQLLQGLSPAVIHE